MIIRVFLIFDATPMSQMAGHNITIWRKGLLRKSEGKPIISLSLNYLDCMLQSQKKKQHFQSRILRGFILIFDATPMSQMAGHYITIWRMVILRKSEGKPIISLSLNSLDCILQSQKKKQHCQSMIIRGFLLIFDSTPMSQMAGHYITIWRKGLLRKSEGKSIISLSLNSLDCMLQSQKKNSISN